MKKALTILSFLLLLFLTVASQERIFQIRNINKVELALSKITSASLIERNYLIPKTGILYLSIFGDFAGEYEITNWLEAGAAGRLVGSKKNNTWCLEHRPMIFCTFSQDLGKVELELYNRVERFILKNLNDYSRYKHILSAEVPPLNFSWLTIFAAEEIFYRFDSNEFCKSRLSLGTKIKYNRSFEMKIYYMLEKNKIPPHWAPNDIFGFNMYVDF